MKLDLLSPNLLLILNQIIRCQNLCKLIYYNQNNPLSQSDLTLPCNNLILTKIFPSPFNINTTLEDCVELRVYYLSGTFDSIGVVENIDIIFDIVCSKTKNLWLINDGSNSLIRPYEITKELINLFDQSLSTVGRLKFMRFNHLYVNDKFDCIRLIANMLTLGS